MGNTKHRQFRRARQRKQLRGIIFVAIVVITLSAAGLLLKQGLWGPSVPVMAGNVIDVRGYMAGFDPKTIRVRAGEEVTLRLINMDSPLHEGGIEHQLAIDDFGINLLAPARQTASVTFTPTEPGVYEFYCDVCCGGRINPSMQGRLIVEAY